MLPLGPTGYGNSPYAARSAMAGNPLLISLDILAKEGLLAAEDLRRDQGLPVDYVDYESVAAFKLPLLREAYRTFTNDAGNTERSEFDAFCQRNGYWLDDYAFFMALRDVHDGVEWLSWEREIATRRPQALARWRHQLADTICFHQFVQFQFYRQWSVLKRYANERGVRIIGDIPIFVALDSADVWSGRNCSSWTSEVALPSWQGSRTTFRVQVSGGGTRSIVGTGWPETAIAGG